MKKLILLILVSITTSYCAVSRTGSITKITTAGQSGDSSITVPADAQLCVFASGFDRDGQSVNYDTVKLGSSALTQRFADTNSGTFARAVVWTLTSPSTGSQTLHWHMNTTMDWGPTIYVAFYKGLNTTSPIASAGGEQAGDASATTGSMDASSGDMFVGIASQFTFTSTDYITFANTTPRDSTYTQGIMSSYTESGSLNGDSSFSCTAPNNHLSLAGIVIAGGCSAPTITRHATITDTIGNSGRYGHSIGGGTADSTKRIGTWPDSAAMVAYTTKDTVAYKWKAKQTLAGFSIRAYGCSDSATAIDSIAIIGPSVAYSTSPQVDTAGRAAINQDVTSAAMADSFTLASALPTGLALTKSGANLGRISGTPTTATAKAGYKVYVWRKDIKADSTYDTITVLRALALDSIRRTFGRAGDTIKIYGTLFGSSQGGSTLAMGDSTPTVYSWADGLIKIKCPSFPDTGHYDFIVDDGVQADTADTAFYYLITTISSISPAKGKRNSILSINSSNLIDSSSLVRANINALSCTITQWSSGTVKATIPGSAPRGYYWPILKYVDGTDTTILDTASTRYRVLLPEIVNDGSN